MNTRRTSSHIVRTLLALTLRDALKASLCAAPLFTALPAAAHSSTPSTTPITIVMTFPAGSGVDIVGRLLQDSMQKSLGTNIVDVSNVLTINPTVVDVKSARAG